MHCRKLVLAKGVSHRMAIRKKEKHKTKQTKKPTNHQTPNPKLANAFVLELKLLGKIATFPNFVHNG